MPVSQVASRPSSLARRNSSVCRDKRVTADLVTPRVEGEEAEFTVVSAEIHP